MSPKERGLSRERRIRCFSLRPWSQHAAQCKDDEVEGFVDALKAKA